jgi:hypothetical protein
MPFSPADVRDHLARAAALTTPSALPPPAAPGRDVLLASISASYFRLRRGLAAISFALPVVLWLGTGLHTPPGSISAYYYFAPGHAGPPGTMRDVFVGMLWAAGSFLVFYRGYSAAENWALNLAGAAAVAIAVSPMDWPADAAWSLHGRLHYAAATVFFLAIAYVCLARSDDTLTLLPVAEQRGFRRLYRVLGTLMVAAPATVVAVGRLVPNDLVLWAVEVAAIDVFAAFWLVKSREIARIEAGPG